MKTVETTKAAEAAYLHLNGGMLLDVKFVTEQTAVFVFEVEDDISITDYYLSEFPKFVDSRNFVFDALNDAKRSRIEDKLEPFKNRKRSE